MDAKKDLKASTSAGVKLSNMPVVELKRKKDKNLKKVDFAQLEVGDFDENAFLRHLKYVLPYHIIFKIDKVRQVYGIVERMTRKSQGNIDTWEIYPASAPISVEESHKAQWSLLELMQILPNVSNLIIHFDVMTSVIEHFPKLLRLDITTSISKNALTAIMNAGNCLSALNLLNSDRNLELDVDQCSGLGHFGFSVEKFSNCSSKIFKMENIAELFIAYQKGTITGEWIECVNRVINAKHDVITFINIGSKNLPLTNWLSQIEFSRCEHLRGINIFNFDFDVRHASLGKLIGSLPQLKYLNLANCINLTPEILLEVTSLRLANQPLELSIEPYLYQEAKPEKLGFIKLMRCSKSCDDFIKGAIFMFQM